mgnify:CR=1 FL=1
MGVGNKGKKVLKNVDYDVFKRAFIQAIMENIREKGVSGQDIQEIIKETLDDKRFNFLVKKSLKNIAKETNMNPKECEQALPVLMEEEVADELDDNLKGEIHNEEKKKKKIDKKGRHQGLWYNLPFKRVLGKKPRLFPEFIKLIKTQRVIRYPLFLGIIFLCIAAVFFNSAYKAILVGLTLTSFQGNIVTQLANVFAGLGGVFLFFISLAITFQYLMTVKKRDDQIKKLADNYLKRTKQLLKNNETSQ